MTGIEVLTPEQTTETLSGHRFGASETLTQIARNLEGVIDTDGSVFVTGLNESNINALRTKMQRRNIRMIVRKVEKDGTVGHVLMARSLGR